MTNRYNTAVAAYTNVVDRLRNNVQEYANFLKFSSGIYKYDFSDAAMIFQQNPNATKVADMETWNKFGRRVNKGERSIAVFGENNKCRYLFDVSQTSGRQSPAIWRLDKDLADRLTKRMNEINGTSNKNLDETIAAMCLDSVKAGILSGNAPYNVQKFDYENQRIVNRTLLSATRYIVSNRCSLNSDIRLDSSLNLSGMKFYKNPDHFKQIADFIHNNAKDVLTRLEKQVLILLKEREKERMEQQARSETEAPMPDYRELPFKAGDGFEQENKYYFVDQIDVSQNLVRLRDINNPNQTKSMGIGELCDYYSEQQRQEAEINAAINGIIGEESPIIANEPVKTEPQVEPIDDNSLIEQLVLDETARYERNSELSSFFSVETDNSKRMEYLKDCYRDGITQINFDGKEYGIEKTEDGLTFFEGTPDNRIRQSGLSWEAVTAIALESHNQKKLYEAEPEIETENISETVEQPEIRNIRCETQEEAESLFSSLRNDGYTWIDGEELERTDWIFGEENTYYTINPEDKTVIVGDYSALSFEQQRNTDFEYYSEIREETVVQQDLPKQTEPQTEPESVAIEPENAEEIETPEKEYDIFMSLSSGKISIGNFNDDGKIFAEINQDRSVATFEEIPEKLQQEIEDFARDISQVYTLPEIREPQKGEPTVTFTFSENQLVPTDVKIPFSQANEILNEIEKNHKELGGFSLAEDSFLGYDKTDFLIEGEYKGEPFTYRGRFDIGDGEGTLMNHIRNEVEYVRNTDWSRTEEEKKAYQENLAAYEEIVIPYLSEYEHYTPESEKTPEISNEHENVTETTEPEQLSIFDEPIIEETKQENIPEPIQTDRENDTPAMFTGDNQQPTLTGKAKFAANAEAIKTLLTVEKEDRHATSEEQAVMAKYSGWGGIPQAFDVNNKAWEREYKELQTLLPLESKEYEDARASSLTSFYTPPEVTEAVYQALEQFGFKNGEILEPSMGVGNFFAQMPEQMRSGSNLHGVEIDSISGRIAQKLYPTADIQVKGFEKTDFQNNSIDVVVGNIPFDNIQVADKDYDKYKFSIHDYFAAKSVDKLKPGGIMAIVASKYVMDKNSEKAREYIAQRADLLGAVRLPAGTFKDADNVTTDILFFKKRDTPTTDIPDWVHMSETPDGIPCNKYFADNPDMVLGKMAWDERMKGRYGENSKITICKPDSDVSLKERLSAAISKIQGEFSAKITRAVSKVKTADEIPANPDVRNYTHTLVNGQLYYRKGNVMKRVTETGTKLERMIGLTKVRDAAMALIDAQVGNCSDSELDKLQKQLEKVYDTFVKNFGNITDRANARVFKGDDDYHTICALEEKNKQTGKIEKAAIFTRRTIRAEEEITQVNTPNEALQVSIDKKGKVDIPFMSEILGSSPEKVISELGTEIFRNPAKVKEDDPYSGYEEKSEYLSGNVREKFDIAREFAEKIDSSYSVNAEALEKVIPPNIQAEDIGVEISTPWIDVEDYSKFMEEYANAKMDYHRLTRNPLGEYKVESKSSGYQDINSKNTYGTSRMTSYQIFENLLNKRDIVVRDKVKDGDSEKIVVNQKETQLARDKARKMKEAFSDWFWKDLQRREKYVERYNRLFNSIRGREYDGSHQTFVGMNPAIELRPHQKNAVLRGKLGGNTLLAHCVGAGKSFEIDTIVMEKKRLGLINKACVVVPKHLTMQTAEEWQRLYPNAKLLVATPEDFTPKKKQEFAARCATGDYDAVIMSYEQFGRIPMSLEYREQFIENQIDELSRAINETDDRTSIKVLEREKKKLQIKLERLLSGKKDNTLEFEKIGFDYVVVDEAHNYKNCLVISKMNNVSGVQTTSAAKSEDMLMKLQYLREQHGDGSCTFATGTPVSNTMVELYSMTRYLRPDLLKSAGLQTFDDWAATFGEVVSQLELKPAGDGFRMKNRFAKFKNLPELMNMYKEFADIQMADTLHIPNVPTMQTGKPIIVTSKPDELQKKCMKQLADRAEAIHNGNIDPRDDNMLKITHEARLLGLDGRCMNKDWKPSPDSKVNKLCDNLEKIYKETEQKKGVQIVFCDIAIHEDSEHFSVYNAVKDELVKRGIPREEICFAGDAKTDLAKSEMYAQLRKGEKRIILASTSKLGTGANVQDRVAAIHHLDIPWRPADLEQQNGRGLRQGNMFEEVGIYHYVTENTFDAYMLGIITSKAKFISQVMTSKEPARVCEDVDEMVLNYSEMQAIASGNPLIKEKIELESKVSELRTLESEYKRNQYKMQELSQKILPESIAQKTDLLAKAKADLEKFNENHQNKDFQININGKTFTERKEAGKEIEKAMLKVAVSGESVSIGNYAGFEIKIENNPHYGEQFMFDSETPCFVSINGNLKYQTSLEKDNPVGNIRRIENLASNSISQRIEEIKAGINNDKTNLEAAEKQVGIPFEHSKELSETLEKLAKVDIELAIDKTDEVQVIDSTDDNAEPEKEDSSLDKAEQADSLMSVKKVDISDLLPTAPEQTESKTVETETEKNTDITTEQKPKPKKGKTI